MSRGVFDRARTSAPSATLDVVGGHDGVGTMLVGPSPRDPENEALVLAPPGTPLPTPEDFDSLVTADGWRVALFTDPSLVDVGRPRWLAAVPLAYALALVAEVDTSRLSWVADRLESRLRSARAATVPDRNGRVFSGALRWNDDAEATLAELEECTTAPATLDRYLAESDVAAALLTDYAGALAGVAAHDDRLHPGALRALWVDLSPDSA